MTDREILEKMFAERGIRADSVQDADDELVVYGGYVGFFTEFSFDKDGKLTKIGAYE